MERLDISTAPERPNIEAAIHIARYAIARAFVNGMRVLDVACGEGYGSYLLKQAGAEHVVGVDVSDATIEQACKSFCTPGLQFVTANAVSIDKIFPGEFFDVVVSCETVEHVADPTAFLKALQKVAKPNATIIVSCPNDHWYYPEQERSNPFHVRKYKFEEFQELATGVLGKEVKWYLGTAVFGFGSTPLSVKENYLKIPDSWMSYREIDGAFIVSGDGEMNLSSTSCSYYYGVWNASDLALGAAFFPLSMDDYALMLDSNATALALLEKRLQAYQAEAQREKRNLGLRLQAVFAENDVMHERLTAMQRENDQLRVAHDRYVRLRNVIPSWMRSFAVKIIRVMRSWV